MQFSKLTLLCREIYDSHNLEQGRTIARKAKENPATPTASALAAPSPPIARLVVDDSASPIIARNAAHYDAVPYTSHPFPLSQPARIGAIAKLFGLAPADVSRARVLEIGCASGGNIIPLAARFPQAQFTGVDISPVQVAAGQARIERHALSNINIHCASITAFEAPAGAFDYIICHGVFSWVDASVRDAILARVGAWLAPGGVADISYNVLPGWRLRQALRDAMILHAGAGEDRAHRVTRARWIANFLKQHTSTTSLWGQVFRNEAALLANLPDDYIGHEFVEDVNDPMTFTAFAGQAATHGLAYLGDADISVMIPENLDPATAVMLREMSGGKALPVEQYMDIVTGRTFRQSLLVRADEESQISRNLDPERLAGLHLVVRGDFRRTESTPEMIVYSDGSGRNLRTNRAAVAAALDILIARLPATSSSSDMIREDMDGAAHAPVLEALVQMLQVGLLALSLEPVHCLPHVSEKPKAAPFARFDAEAGPTVVGARHEAVHLGIVAQTILPALDGSRDRAALQSLVIAAVAAGRLSFQREGMQIATPAGVAREAASHIEASLIDLARAGLLIA